MTQTNRLALNTVVSYSRSLLALFLGLFSARWVLQALGQDDYGLYGVVGSLLASISFVNVSLSGSISRFYAFSIGAASNMDKSAAEHDLRGWFNAALIIHSGLALLLLLVGLPLGEYVIRNILTIPPDRMAACVWVFRLSVFSSLVGLISVPYCAFYTAYQYIAELTVFEMIRTVFNFICAYILLHVKSDRLVAYSLMMASVSVIVTLGQLWRTQYQFPVRMSLRYFKIESSRVKEVVRFGALKLMGIVGWIFKAHGSAFVINLNFSPRENAAYSIANQVVVHSTALATALVNAIAPALTTFSGSGDLEKMRSYAIRTCKMSGFLVLLFAAPLICEIDYVLKLWLKEPPVHATQLCSLFLVAFFIDTLSVGCMTAIGTETRIGKWQLAECIILVANVPILFLCYQNSLAFISIGYVFILLAVLIVCERLYFANRIVGVSPMAWVRNAFLPTTMIFLTVRLLGFTLHTFMSESFMRLVVVTVASLLVSIALFFTIATDESERRHLRALLDKVRLHS